MPSTVIDFHVHAFPENLPLPGPLAKLQLPLANLREIPRVKNLKRVARSWAKPVTSSLHRAQTLFRHLPSPLLEGMDEISGIVPVAGLLLESSVADLLESMEDNEIDQALLIAHPPVIPNEFVLEAAKSDPRLIAAVNIPKSAQQPSAILESFVEKGARVLKIHPAADGEGAKSKRYLALLAAAREMKLPVIIHTGCLHSKILFKDAEISDAANFKPWFKEFSDVTFILAHMNFHKPSVAMDLAEEFGNVHMDTSWQPAETIGEAVRRVGASRVLFGSDWPLLGNNLSVGLQRIDDCVATGMISADDAKLILGKNAERILSISPTTSASAGAPRPEDAG